MKNNYKKIILFSTIIFLFSFNVSFAQVPDYTVLAPLPGVSGPTSLSSYIPAIFRLSIGIAAAMAFVMITFGGIMYATSDALSGKSQGRKYIEDALWGLLLVIGAYAILYTINPQILSFNLSITTPPQTTSGPPVTSPPGTGSCTTCVAITGVSANITSSGKNISPVLLPKIQALDQSLQNSLVGWRITEAYPPSRTHQNPCHTMGTCIDANVSSATAANINAFARAASQAGLMAVYEVQTAAEQSALIASGVTARIDIEPLITGPHFSVYNN